MRVQVVHVWDVHESTGLLRWWSTHERCCASECMAVQTIVSERPELPRPCPIRMRLASHGVELCRGRVDRPSWYVTRRLRKRHVNPMLPTCLASLRSAGGRTARFERLVKGSIGLAKPGRQIVLRWREQLEAVSCRRKRKRGWLEQLMRGAQPM